MKYLTRISEKTDKKMRENMLEKRSEGVPLKYT